MSVRPEDHINQHSRPSELKITDVRTVTIGWDRWRFPLVRIDTNQGLSGYGEVRDGATKNYALELKSRILNENPCNVDKIFRKIKQFGGHARQGGGVSGVEVAVAEDVAVREAREALESPGAQRRGEKPGPFDLADEPSPLFGHGGRNVRLVQFSMKSREDQACRPQSPGSLHEAVKQARPIDSLVDKACAAVHVNDLANPWDGKSRRRHGSGDLRLVLRLVARHPISKELKDRAVAPGVDLGRPSLCEERHRLVRHAPIIAPRASPGRDPWIAGHRESVWPVVFRQDESPGLRPFFGSTIQDLPGIAHAPARDPYEVAVSWTSFHGTVGALQSGFKHGLNMPPTSRNVCRFSQPTAVCS